MRYHIWTEGCQMNVADSYRVAAALEDLNYTPTNLPNQADVIVLNTCVVRKSAEQKAIGRLTSLKPLKIKNPDLVINLMGCMVGVHDSSELHKRYPYVDVFSQPSDPRPLIDYLQGKVFAAEKYQEISNILDTEFAYKLPATKEKVEVTAFLPIVFGCSHACSYCIIPLRRGREISRPPDEIISDANALVASGVKEITLLGQIVDRYGQDQSGYPTLSALLRKVHQIEGLQRIRFLTSHPNWMTDDILDAVADLPKVMPHFELPNQAGDDSVLRNMRRGYTIDQYINTIKKIRNRLGTVSIATDIIVGFPGESEAQFNRSVDVLKTVRPDMTHVARYSPRPGTYSAKKMIDDVPPEEKMRRFRIIEKLQEEISTEINHEYLGRKVPVFFEGKSKGRWRGRTPTNKLVFIEDKKNLLGKIIDVEITWTGPWSMIGITESLSQQQ
ncbi:MAG: tRNA (N6-isopentenyl adenosine(37)-C2)-methylthiotransferase MiaB [Anaerolineaceae bacterium]|nr:tRNA (N6-isopentenyl adenosine(37)-C2)-methylthiotransferase MiaB [Anaerolineaceae bacterium]